MGYKISAWISAYPTSCYLIKIRLLDIQKIRTSGYRPQRNGQTEQSNETIKRYLTAFLADNKVKSDWDLLLKQLAYAYNSSEHTSTKFSPAELMFGRPFRLPIDVLYGSGGHIRSHSIEEFRKNMTAMYRCAQKVMKRRQAQMKALYDKKRTSDPLSIGDMVYVYSPRVNKLEPKWDGPHEIVSKSENVYEIAVKQEAKITYQWLPRDRLRRCLVSTMHGEQPTESHNIEPTTVAVDDSSTSESSESEDENDPPGVPYGYDLRPRPIPAMQRFQISQLKLI